MSKSLFGADLAMQMEREARRTLGPAFDLANAMRKIEDAMCPPSMRYLIDMDERISRLSDPFGMKGLLGGVQHSAQLESISNVVAALREDKAILAAVRMRDLAEPLHKILGGDLRPFSKLESSLSGLLAADSFARWEHHLAKSALPALNILEAGPSVGILQGVEGLEAASLAWNAETGPSRVAAWIDEECHLPKITIEVNVACAFCGEQMLTHERQLRWRGSRKGSLDITVVPICARCTKRSFEDPDYALRMLRDLGKPRLRIISGGKTDGVRRGRLQLVPTERPK